MLRITQIIQARALATKRGARYVSAEDLIFLIRHDRGKVNRLRTYLSWKDVRKHAKESGGDGGGPVEVDPLEEGGLSLLYYHHPCYYSSNVKQRSSLLKPKRSLSNYLGK